MSGYDPALDAGDRLAIASGRSHRRGRVMAVAATTCTVRLGGDTGGTDVALVPFLTARPNVGDQVLLGVIEGGGLCVLGGLATDVLRPWTVAGGALTEFTAAMRGDGGTNPAFGSTAVWKANYARNGPTVTVHARVNAGGVGVVPGTGAWYMVPPVGFPSAIFTPGVIEPLVGTFVYMNGAALWQGVIAAADSNVARFYYVTANGAAITNVTGAAPFVLANNSTFMFTMHYLAA